MANATTEVTLDALHEAITGAIRAQFPDLATVEAYRQDRKNLPVPACLVELSEMEAGNDLDLGTEQLAVMARFEARLVIGFRQGGRNPGLEIRKLAAAVAAFVHQQRWGLPVGPADVLGAWPDDFDPNLEQYECWRIEWQQVIHLGESVWHDEGVTPEPVLSWAPEIGAGHEADYEPVVRHTVSDALSAGPVAGADQPAGAPPLAGGQP
nr:MAG TPA: tail completion protein [Caudoviricetes sp.]